MSEFCIALSISFLRPIIGGCVKLCPMEESESSEGILKLFISVRKFNADGPAFEKFRLSHFEHTQEKSTVCVYPIIICVLASGLTLNIIPLTTLHSIAGSVLMTSRAHLPHGNSTGPGLDSMSADSEMSNIQR